MTHSCFECFHFNCTYEGYSGGWSGPPESPEGFCEYGLLSGNHWYNEAEHCNEFIGCQGLRKDMENQFIVRGYEWAMDLVKKIVEHKTGIEITKLGFNKHVKEEVVVFHLGYDPLDHCNCFHYEEYCPEIYGDMKIEKAGFSINNEKMDIHLDIKIGNTLWLIKDERWILFEKNYCNLCFEQEEV